MACFEVIILQNRIESALQVKNGENFNEKEGTTNDISQILSEYIAFKGCMRMRLTGQYCGK